MLRFLVKNVGKISTDKLFEKKKELKSLNCDEVLIFD